MSHTPTPWKLTGLMSSDGIAIESTVDHWVVALIEPDVDEDDEGQDSNYNSDEQRKLDQANAEFIIRAVNCHDELLHALKAVELGVFGSMIPGSDIDVCTRATRAEVRAAIAIAEGKQ
ncbi:MAG TPA: hypothetical protein VNU68_34825 [Verrucomicrobiae bacterium]|nr:hypothetical protein [Verrucomicrobiae bacterium]